MAFSAWFRLFGNEGGHEQVYEGGCVDGEGGIKDMIERVSVFHTKRFINLLVLASRGSPH